MRFVIKIFVISMLSYHFAFSQNQEVVNKDIKVENVKENKNASKDSRDNSNGQDDELAYQKIIDQYKAYLKTLKLEIQNEVVEYRGKVKDLNKQKAMLYKQLSQEAQDYLFEEQKFKRKLPFKKRDMIKIENKEEKKVDQ